MESEHKKIRKITKIELLRWKISLFLYQQILQEYKILRTNKL
ncbi:8695_t:CDS:2 [Ambispora leptoticha]|uniref:8695_t:CDS:1 n=1 Tax=Ambispora leptoticha TaxID=144679 RepID=A0A9N9BQ62_9GLOM|nr:8695_t:CDS:2 [Ambispora leptoticha]